MKKSIVIVFGIVLLGGCSADDEEAASINADEVAERYGYDIETADELPVYALNPAFESDPGDRNNHIFMADCLDGVVEYDVPSSDNHSELFTRTGNFRFNEEIAAEWGYPSLRTELFSNHQAAGIPDGVELTEEQSAENEKCVEEMQEALDEPNPVDLNGFSEAGWDALDGNTAVAEAEDAWRECMEPEGVVDLPESPEEMPSDSLSGNEQTEDGMQVDDTEVDLTEKERDIAIADAKCRSEAGYDDAVFKAEAEGELEAIGKDIETFEAARAEFEDYQERIDTVLAEHG